MNKRQKILIVDDAKFNRDISVSYTHLDVYKRQDHCPDFHTDISW